jgi:hypothetical protein
VQIAGSPSAFWGSSTGIRPARADLYLPYREAEPWWLPNCPMSLARLRQSDSRGVKDSSVQDQAIPEVKSLYPDRDLELRLLQTAAQAGPSIPRQLALLTVAIALFTILLALVLSWQS